MLLLTHDSLSNVTLTFPCSDSACTQVISGDDLSFTTSTCTAGNGVSLYATCNSNTATSGWQLQYWTSNTACSGSASSTISSSSGSNCMYTGNSGHYIKVDCSGGTSSSSSSNAVVVDAWTYSDSCSGSMTAVGTTVGACNSLQSFGKSASTQVFCDSTSSSSGWTAKVYQGYYCQGSAVTGRGSGMACASLASYGLSGASVAVNCAGTAFSSASKTGAAVNQAAAGMVGAVATGIAALAVLA